MSSSPTFIVSHTKEVEDEQLLARDQGRSHTSSPRSRPKSRLEVLIMEFARSTEQRFENLARSQAEQSRSTEGKLDGLAKGQADLAYAQIGHVADLANIMGRISSVEKSLHGTPSPSPFPGRGGSPPSGQQCTYPCLPLRDTSFPYL